MSEKIAVYAGSFDPVTNGHVNVARRAREVFGQVVVLLIQNGRKKPLFSQEERLELLRQTFAGEDGIRVEKAEGLLVDYMQKHNLHILVRGLRGPADLEPELANAYYNKQFYPKVETVFLPTRAEYAFLSSSAVREAAGYGADVSSLVPVCVAKALQKIKEKSSF